MILIINICKDPIQYFEFVKPIEDILRNNEIKFSTRHYKELKARDISQSTKAIICGTSLADNEFMKKENLKKFHWIEEYKKPVLGICGGSHIIGLLLGYKIQKEEEIGLKEINIEKEFLGIKGKGQVYHLHQFKVLPEVFQSDNLYATLFHPEVRNKGIILNFAKI